MLIDLKIEVTKIPKDWLFKSEKTGKIYADIKVGQRQTPDEYGNTHYAYMQKSKDDEKVYVGNGKTVDFAPKESAPIESDDLPF
jgi:hypothetical protein